MGCVRRCDPENGWNGATNAVTPQMAEMDHIFRNFVVRYADDAAATSDSRTDRRMDGRTESRSFFVMFFSTLRSQISIATMRSLTRTSPKDEMIMTLSMRWFHSSRMMISLLVSFLCIASCIECIGASPSEQDGPTAWIDGKRISIADTFPKVAWEDTHYFVLNEDKHLWYMESFLNASMAQELRSFCQDQGRFQRSPVREKSDSQIHVNQGQRTSESCPLIPAALYRGHPKFEKDIRGNPETAHVEREVDVAWAVAERAAKWLEMGPERVEALQVVRYTSPDAEYQVHHDHGAYYGKDTELRPFTILVFLNSVASGGYTSFPVLKTKIRPRLGDAIVWSNELEGGAADRDVVHAGEPPGMEGIEKYALNVWMMRAPADAASYSTAWDAAEKPQEEL